MMGSVLCFIITHYQILFEFSRSESSQPKWHGRWSWSQPSKEVKRNLLVTVSIICEVIEAAEDSVFFEGDMFYLTKRMLEKIKQEQGIINKTEVVNWDRESNLTLLPRAPGFYRKVLNKEDAWLGSHFRKGISPWRKDHGKVRAINLEAEGLLESSVSGSRCEMLLASTRIPLDRDVEKSLEAGIISILDC